MPSSVLGTDNSTFFRKKLSLPAWHSQARGRPGLPLATKARAAPGGGYELFVPSSSDTAACCGKPGRPPWSYSVLSSGGAGTQPGGECSPGCSGSGALGELGEHKHQGELRSRMGVRVGLGVGLPGETPAHLLLLQPWLARRQVLQCPRWTHAWPRCP